MHEASVEKPNQSANHCSRFIPAHIRIDTQSRWRNPSNLGPTSLLLTALLTLAAHSPAQEQPQTPAPAASPSSATSTSIPSAPPAQAVQAPSKTAPYKRQFKHLKRIPPEPGTLADHACTKEYHYRLEDYLASVPDEEIAEYRQAAERGDSDAMFLLSQVVRQDADGRRYTPYRESWFQKAVDLDHPVARYQAARVAQLEHVAGRQTPTGKGTLQIETGDGGSITVADFQNGDLGIVLVEKPDAQDLAFLKLAEAATEQQGSGEIAWQMANAYARTGLAPREFQFLPASPGKARHWAIKAAERGNIPAAEALCNAYSNGDSRYGIRAGDKANDSQAAQWCLLAGRAGCSTQGAYSLAKLYDKGQGLPKSAIDELCWRKRGDMLAWRLNGRQGPPPYEIEKFPIVYPGEEWRPPYGAERCAGVWDMPIDELTNTLRPDELAVYEARAAKGDADAMYLLSRVLKLSADGTVDDSVRKKWQLRAAAAGHPVARYEMALQAINGARYRSYEERDVALRHILPLRKAAARAEGSGYLVWEFVSIFNVLDFCGDTGGVDPSDLRIPKKKRCVDKTYKMTFVPAQAQAWAKLALVRGYPLAIFAGCTAYVHPGWYQEGLTIIRPLLNSRVGSWDSIGRFEAIKVQHPLNSGVDGRLLCVTEAVGPGMASGKHTLGEMYRDGIGFPKSALDSLYWSYASDEYNYRSEHNLQGEVNHE